VNKEFQKFSENLKKTSFGVRFGKKLFTDPNSMTSAQITQAMRMLGLPIPKELEIAHTIAQAMVSGSAIVEAYDDYQDFQDAESLESLGESTADGIAVFSSLAKQFHWLDNDTASELTVATDLVRIISSAGADVSAWIGLALEISSQEGRAQSIADNLAKKGNADWIKWNVSQQSKNLASHLAELNKGDIGLFGFIVKSAYDADMIFREAIVKNDAIKEKLPGIELLPNLKGWVTTNASASTWYGSSKSASETSFYDSVGKFASQNDAIEYIFSQVIEPYTYGYLVADQYYEGQGKASIMSAASLAVVAGDGYFDQGQNFSKLFKLNRLSPFDVGDGLSNFQPKVAQAGITFQNKVLNKEVVYTNAQVNELNHKGKIEELLKSKQVADYLKYKYTFDYFPVPETTVKMDWRDVGNFISCLNFLDLVFSDPFYKKGLKLDRIERYGILGHLNNWKAITQDAYNKSTIRSINQNARANIAYFLQTDAKKLIMKQDYKPGQPAIFK
jgi:hypothetical protein